MSTPASDERAPRLTVIVPAYQCAPMLRRCLDGLLASDLPRDTWELIVADDGSTDDTPTVARAVANMVITTPNGPRGPGFARNLAAQRARGDILMFVDADVVVAPNTLSGFVHAFERHPDVVAISGSYDLAPGDPSFLSQYRNLLHHYVHQLGSGDAATFWAGCGAIRREAFLRVGGYDTRRYPRPQIEDIELGYRLGAAGGRLLMDGTLQGAHLKRWTLWGMLRTDFRDRAVPWMHLLLDRGETVGDGPLNLQRTEKLLTALTGLSVLGVLASIVTREARWLWMSVGALALVALGNWPLFRWFAKVRGPLFAMGVVPLRLLYYFVSGFGAAWALVSHWRQPTFAPLQSLGSMNQGTSEVRS